MARISVDELDRLLQNGETPVILDVRSPLSSQQTGRIPGALITSVEEMGAIVLDIPESGEVIVYCACPNEASAARVAKLLMQKGYTKVRPLAGGIDAWIAAGYSTIP
jgi:rhodanese-related sulfurtransferase